MPLYYEAALYAVNYTLIMLTRWHAVVANGVLMPCALYVLMRCAMRCYGCAAILCAVSYQLLAVALLAVMRSLCGYSMRFTCAVLY
jgi:hypothetical protein